MTPLTQFIGDSYTHQIPLAWRKLTFDPTGWALIWTAKRFKTDADADALIQKSSGAGITVGLEGSAWYGYVELVPDDTTDLGLLVVHWDIQAQRISDGVVRTVAEGTLQLKRDITRELTTSIPVITTTTPVPVVTSGTGTPYTPALVAETVGSATFVHASSTGIRPAYAPLRPACGFVRAATTAGLTAQVFSDGELNGLSGLVRGTAYYLGVSAGSIVSTPPTTGILQRLGVAVATDTLLVEISDPIELS